MTKEEQRIAIAEWMGWTNIVPGNEIFNAMLGKTPSDKIVSMVPNYPEDLNAMHEAEDNLLKSKHTDTLGSNYWNKLWAVCGDKFKLTQTAAHAKAFQRSEALCRILWPERWKK